MSTLLIFAILSLLSLITRADDRAHGLAHESPIAISPQAYAFFHPNALQPSACDSSNCSSLPLAATMQSTPAHDQSPSTGGRGMGPAGVAGISLGLVFACLIAVGLYYVVLKRRANLRRSNPQQLA